MKLLRTAIAIARLPIDLFQPNYRRPAHGAARTIANRGLGVHERNAMWVDNIGDFWRFNPAAQQWEYRDADGDQWSTTMTGPGGYTSASYAPYRELQLGEQLTTTK